MPLFDINHYSYHNVLAVLLFGHVLHNQPFVFNVLHNQPFVFNVLHNQPLAY